MTYLYIAGPLFNTQDRWYLERITERFEALGYETFLPHRDVGLLEDFGIEQRKATFRGDMVALDRCDAVVALLTGTDHDSGTSAEIGYTYARRKPIFAITDDIRWKNNFVWGMCAEGETIASNIEELVALVHGHFSRSA
jgi:nucleoside 2-deoxyribosyltransferase